MSNSIPAPPAKPGRPGPSNPPAPAVLPQPPAGKPKKESNPFPDKKDGDKKKPGAPAPVSVTAPPAKGTNPSVQAGKPVATPTVAAAGGGSGVPVVQMNQIPAATIAAAGKLKAVVHDHNVPSVGPPAPEGGIVGLLKGGGSKQTLKDASKPPRRRSIFRREKRVTGGSVRYTEMWEVHFKYYQYKDQNKKKNIKDALLALSKLPALKERELEAKFATDKDDCPAAPTDDEIDQAHKAAAGMMKVVLERIKDANELAKLAWDVSSQLQGACFINPKTGESIRTWTSDVQPVGFRAAGWVGIDGVPGSASKDQLERMWHVRKEAIPGRVPAPPKAGFVPNLDEESQTALDGLKQGRITKMGRVRGASPKSDIVMAEIRALRRITRELHSVRSEPSFESCNLDPKKFFSYDPFGFLSIPSHNIGDNESEHNRLVVDAFAYDYYDFKRQSKELHKTIISEFAAYNESWALDSLIEMMDAAWALNERAKRNRDLSAPKKGNQEAQKDDENEVSKLDRVLEHLEVLAPHFHPFYPILDPKLSNTDFSQRACASILLEHNRRKVLMMMMNNVRHNFKGVGEAYRYGMPWWSMDWDIKFGELKRKDFLNLYRVDADRAQRALLTDGGDPDVHLDLCDIVVRLDSELLEDPAMVSLVAALWPVFGLAGMRRAVILHTILTVSFTIAVISIVDADDSPTRSNLVLIYTMCALSLFMAGCYLIAEVVEFTSYVLYGDEDQSDRAMKDIDRKRNKQFRQAIDKSFELIAWKYRPTPYTLGLFVSVVGGGFLEHILLISQKEVLQLQNAVKVLYKKVKKAINKRKKALRRKKKAQEEAAVELNTVELVKTPNLGNGARGADADGASAEEVDDDDEDDDDDDEDEEEADAGADLAEMGADNDDDLALAQSSKKRGGIKHQIRLIYVLVVKTILEPTVGRIFKIVLLWPLNFVRYLRMVVWSFILHVFPLLQVQMLLKTTEHGEDPIKPSILRILTFNYFVLYLRYFHNFVLKKIEAFLANGPRRMPEVLADFPDSEELAPKFSLHKRIGHTIVDGCRYLISMDYLVRLWHAISLPAYIFHYENYIEILSFIGVFTVCPYLYRDTYYSENRKFFTHVFAAEIILLYVRYLQFLDFSKTLGLTARVFLQMIKDSVAVLVFVVMFITTFALAFYVINKSSSALCDSSDDPECYHPFETTDDSMMSMIRLAIGDADYVWYDHAGIFSRILYGVYIIMVTVMGMNLLIAIMTNSYETISSSAEKEISVVRMQIIRKHIHVRIKQGKGEKLRQDIKRALGPRWWRPVPMVSSLIEKGAHDTKEKLDEIANSVEYLRDHVDSIEKRLNKMGEKIR